MTYYLDMARDKTPKKSVMIVLGSQYFLYFGVMGIFLPYFNLYCYHLKFTGFQIGVLSAIRTGAILVFPLVWGILADIYRIRRSIYILCNFISTIIWIFYIYTTDFRAMFMITIIYGIFHAPIISFLEAFTMDLLGREKKSYGRVRAWGTINFIIIAVLLGRIIDSFPVEIILVLIFAGSLAQAIISAKIPETSIAGKKIYKAGPAVFLNSRIIIFLFSAFLMLASHGTYYGFYSIHLENLGYGNTFIGVAWALASIAEVLVMIRSRAIFKRFSLEGVLIFSFMAAALRWLCLYFAHSCISLLVLQLFHAFTYGTFHMASILYIDKLFPDETKTFGQAANNAVTYGLGMTAGFIFSGIFYESIGPSMLFVISGLIALFGGALLWCYNITGQKPGIKIEKTDG